MPVERRKFVHAFVSRISNSVVPFPLSPSPNYVNRLAAGDRFQLQRISPGLDNITKDQLQLIKLTIEGNFLLKCQQSKNIPSELSNNCCHYTWRSASLLFRSEVELILPSSSLCPIQTGQCGHIQTVCLICPDHKSGNKKNHQKGSLFSAFPKLNLGKNLQIKCFEFLRLG